jgi:hypothetical protein
MGQDEYLGFRDEEESKEWQQLFAHTMKEL